MKEKSLAELLDGGLSRFRSKRRFAQACGIPESKLYAWFAGDEKPGLLQAFRLSLGLGENPVAVLRACEQVEAAELTARFVPDAAREPVDAELERLIEKVRDLAAKGLLRKVVEAIDEVEGPWRYCGECFRDIVSEAEADAGFLAVRKGRRSKILFTESCQGLSEPVEAGSDGWRDLSHERDGVVVQLFLRNARRNVEAQGSVFLRMAFPLVFQLL